MAGLRYVTLIVFTLAVCATGAQEARRYVEPRTAADAALPPYSGAVQVGKTLYLSGRIGIDANNKVPDTAEA